MRDWLVKSEKKSKECEEQIHGTAADPVLS
jgi:hypothetical protein